MMLIAAPILLHSGQLHPDEVKTYISMLDRGQTDEVRRALPDLVTKYQNTAGLLFLQGRLASDGTEAVKFYQGIVDNFPRSEYADNALYRVYQYYSALGLYRTAEKKMAQLKRDYPGSSFVTGKPAAQLPTREEAAIKLPPKETATSDTLSTAPPESRAPQTPAPYALQVGAFSTMANAEKQKAFFEERGYGAEITDKVRAGRSLHLVWVGNFRSAEEAGRQGKEIKSKYKIDSIVVEKY
jgi:cell division septation protein DedD